MTMLNTDLPTQEVNGGADDPFAAHNDVSSPNGGATPVVSGDAPAAKTTQTPATPAAPVATPPPAEPVKVEKSDDGDKVSRAELEKLLAATKAAQSSYDKQINALKEQAKAERDARIASERESKLSSMDLSDDEKSLLKEKWSLEDERNLIAEEREENEKFFRSVYIARSVSTHEQFGVTAEQLEACTEPEEMDAVCLRAEVAFYRDGKHLTAKPTATLAEALAADPAAGVPAGAQSPTDIGGGSIQEPAPALSTGTGIDAMMASLSATPKVAFKFN